MVLSALATLALCVLLPAPADDLVPEPAVVQTFSPLEGTRGAVLQVSGEHFGDKRPRAWLEPQDGSKPKKRRLRVLEFSDDQLSLQLRAAKIPAGDYTLFIAPRGKHALPVAAGEPFTVRAARVDLYEPSFITVQTEIDLVGKFFGTLGKPRVRIDGRRARVLEASNSRVTVRLPKKLEGDTEVTVRTAAGEADGPCVLYVHGNECELIDGLPDGELFCPTVADDFVYLEVAGHEQWALAPKFDARFLDGGTRLVAQTASIKSPSGFPAYLRVEFAIEPGDDKTPIQAAALTSVSYTIFDGSPKGHLWELMNPEDGKHEWKAVHCFSYAHVVAKLRSTDGGVPGLLQSLIILRFDTMGLIQAAAESEPQEDPEGTEG